MSSSAATASDETFGCIRSHSWLKLLIYLATQLCSRRENTIKKKLGDVNRTMIERERERGEEGEKIAKGEGEEEEERGSEKRRQSKMH